MNKKIPQPAHGEGERRFELERATSSFLGEEEKRRIALAVKEDLGLLGQRDFDELLSVDFREQILDNSPLGGVFSPETELAKIKSLTRGQKKEALMVFKENLARQREAWAACRIFIERCIQFDNDAPREKLEAWIHKFGEHYGFSNEQKKIAERLIDGYYANRQRALEIRRRYPDNKALVSKLSGIKFDSAAEFDVSIGPMSVDITTNGFNAGRLYQTFYKDIVVSFPYLGFAVTSGSVFYTVINRDKRQSEKATLTHEHEHLKNGLFQRIFDRQFRDYEGKFFYLRYAKEKDPQAKRELLEAFFRLHAQEAFQDAKDEVIAMKKDRASYPYNYFFFKQDGGSYDYLAKLMDREEKKSDELWQETAKKVLVDEYRRIFEKSLVAFDQLEEGGYAREEVIAMLADKPFPRWPKTAKRLLGQRKK